MSTCPACQEKIGAVGETPEDWFQEICPSCGIQFGYNDARADLRDAVYEEWRAAWVANNRLPIEGEKWQKTSKEVLAKALERTNTS